MIKKLNSKELYNFIKANNYILNQEQFIKVRDHKCTDDLTFWKNDGKYSNYSITILKDNGNIFEDIDIYVKNK